MCESATPAVVVQVTATVAWWGPHEPTDAQRSEYAQWNRRGRLLLQKDADETMHDGPSWQHQWTARDEGCGSWCCYSMDCGDIGCDACNKSSVWPRCPKCDAVFRSLEPPSICTHPFPGPSPVDAGADKAICGWLLSGDGGEPTVRRLKRYVCAKQVAYPVPDSYVDEEETLLGDGGTVEVKRTRRQCVLDPTFCASYCEDCVMQGLVRHDTQHTLFVIVHPDGRHEGPVELGPLVGSNDRSSNNSDTRWRSNAEAIIRAMMIEPTLSTAAPKVEAQLQQQQKRELPALEAFFAAAMQENSLTPHAREVLWTGLLRDSVPVYTKRTTTSANGARDDDAPVVAAEEELIDCVILCPIEEGDQYVQPWQSTCSHVMLLESFESFVQSLGSIEQLGKCPGCRA